MQELDGEGDYELWLAWGEGSVGCDHPATEPISWSALVWPPP
jgi:hypothetical protein